MPTRGERARANGVGVVDACITGGQDGAEQGTLVYMVGGAAEDIERCRPAFETSAKKIVVTGELGSGAGTKLCNNLMTYLGFLATFEPLDEGTQLTWRLIYGGVALGVLLAMVRVIRGPRAGGEAS